MLRKFKTMFSPSQPQEILTILEHTVVCIAPQAIYISNAQDPIFKQIAKKLISKNKSLDENAHLFLDNLLKYFLGEANIKKSLKLIKKETLYNKEKIIYTRAGGENIMELEVVLTDSNKLSGHRDIICSSLLIKLPTDALKEKIRKLYPNSYYECLYNNFFDALNYTMQTLQYYAFIQKSHDKVKERLQKMNHFAFLLLAAGMTPELISELKNKIIEACNSYVINGQVVNTKPKKIKEKLQNNQISAAFNKIVEKTKFKGKQHVYLQLLCYLKNKISTISDPTPSESGNENKINKDQSIEEQKSIITSSFENHLSWLRENFNNTNSVLDVPRLSKGSDDSVTIPAELTEEESHSPLPRTDLLRGSRVNSLSKPLTFFNSSLNFNGPDSEQKEAEPAINSDLKKQLFNELQASLSTLFNKRTSRGQLPYTENTKEENLKEEEHNNSSTDKISQRENQPTSNIPSPR